MSSAITDWEQIHGLISGMEARGVVTRTFRRLDPERRQAIIAAILDEALERGPASLNIKLVAARAGVSVGALYTYFTSRDGLVDFAVELCVRQVTSMFAEYGPLLAALPLRDGLAAYLSGGATLTQAQLGLWRLFARAAYHGDDALGERLVRPIADAMRGTVRDMLAAAMARGELRADLDLDASSRVLHALLVAIGDAALLPYLNTYLQVTGPDVAPERALDAALELVLHGLAARAAEGAESAVP